MERLVTTIKHSLDEQIGLYLTNLPVYMDLERLSPGFRYNDALARAICDSVCMVLLYTPVYEESEWCVQELATMQAVERKRFELLGSPPAGHGLIIPIVLAGLRSLPPPFKGHVHFYDFTRAVISQRILKTMHTTERINNIAEYIKYCHDYLLPIGDQLDNYYAGVRLPSAPPTMRDRSKGTDYYLPLRSPFHEATQILR